MAFAKSMRWRRGAARHVGAHGAFAAGRAHYRLQQLGRGGAVVAPFDGRPGAGQQLSSRGQRKPPGVTRKMSHYRLVRAITRPPVF